MYRQVYKLYKRIFTKLLDYYKHVEKGIEFGYSHNGLNNCAIYGSKFGLSFCDPINIKDLYMGKIGSADNKKIKAYYYHFDLDLSIEKLNYVELICENTGINITNKNLPSLGEDINPQTEPFINILKLKFVIEQYLSFYKKIKKDVKKRIDEEQYIHEEYSYPSTDSDCNPEICKKPYKNDDKKFLPKNYPIIPSVSKINKTLLDKWNDSNINQNCNSVCSSLTNCDKCNDAMCKKCCNPKDTIKYYKRIVKDKSVEPETKYTIQKDLIEGIYDKKIKQPEIEIEDEEKKRHENNITGLEKITLNLDLDSDLDKLIKSLNKTNKNNNDNKNTNIKIKKKKDCKDKKKGCKKKDKKK